MRELMTLLRKWDGNLARKLALLAFCACFCGGWDASVAATALADLGPYIKQFESSYQGVRTLSARFVQVYSSEGRTRTESGTVYFAKGGLMRWDYDQPRKKIFLSDGKKLLLYVPDEQQLTRTALKSSDDIHVPFRLLLSRLNLRKIFTRIEYADSAWKHDPDDRILRGYPKGGDSSGYDNVLLDLGPSQDIKRLRLTYPDQSTMEFTFQEIQRNPRLDPSLFRFVPPPGTEVIDQH